MRRIYEFRDCEGTIIRIEETNEPNSLILHLLDPYWRELAQVVISRQVWKEMHNITDGYRSYETFTYQTEDDAPKETTVNPTTLFNEAFMAESR